MSDDIELSFHTYADAGKPKLTPQVAHELAALEVEAAELMRPEERAHDERLLARAKANPEYLFNPEEAK